MKEVDKQTKCNIIAFVVVLTIGVSVRIFNFGNVPFGLNQDEVSMAYDSYADMTYGMDRNGDHNPIYAVAWGSGQNMGYNYIVRPFIAMFGLSTFAIRLPMLLLNIVSLVIFYFLVRSCMGEKIAFWAFFLLTICPWHIMISRWALESNLAVPVLIFANYCFVKARQKKGYFIAGMISSALCIYAYSATIFLITIFVPVITIYCFIKKIVPKSFILIGCATFIIITLPMIVFLVVNLFKLPPCHFLWFSVPRLSEMRSNATTIFSGDTALINVFFNNMLNFLKLLKNMDDDLISNAIPHIGAIYTFLLPFIILGAVIITKRMRKEAKDMFVPFLWLIAALFQAMVVIVNINRINVLFPMLVLCAAVGLDFLFKRIKGTSVVVPVVCILCFTVFCGNYFNDYKKNCQGLFFCGFVEAVTYATQNSSGNVYFTNQVNSPYIFSLYAQKTDPRDFLNSVEYDNLDSPSRYVYYYDCFITGIPVDLSTRSGDAYIFHCEDEIPIDIKNSNYEYEKFNYYIVVLIK